LHLSASQWYEQAGLTGPAVRHALAAQAFDRAAMLVEQVAPVMIQRTELTRLLTWIEALPEDEVQARPLLALYYCRLLYVSGQIEVTVRLEAVEAENLTLARLLIAQGSLEEAEALLLRLY
jgi:LuxR family maltose regulon positive regulatory protein